MCCRCAELLCSVLNFHNIQDYKYRHLHLIVCTKCTEIACFHIIAASKYATLLTLFCNPICNFLLQILVLWMTTWQPYTAGRTYISHSVSRWYGAAWGIFWYYTAQHGVFDNVTLHNMAYLILNCTTWIFDIAWLVQHGPWDNRNLIQIWLCAGGIKMKTIYTGRPEPHWWRLPG